MRCPESSDQPDQATVSSLAVSPWPVRAVWNRIVGSLSLSRAQAGIGMLAGSVSIVGALFSLVQMVHPTNRGDLVTVVQEAASHRPLPDAAVEVLTADNALVGTLPLDATGRAVKSLREGVYIVRVSHPRYAVEVRHVQVLSRQSVEVKAALHAGSSPSVISAGVHAVRRALHF
jgi:hypothetical protein